MGTAKRLGNIMEKLEVLEGTESTLQEKTSTCNSKASGKLDASRKGGWWSPDPPPVPKSSRIPAGNKFSRLQCRKVGRKKLQPTSGKLPLGPKPGSSKPKPASPSIIDLLAKPAPSKKALSKADKQSAKVQSKMSRIQRKMSEVYVRESCDNPRSHPKVKKLNRALAKLR